MGLYKPVASGTGCCEPSVLGGIGAKRQAAWHRARQGFGRSSTPGSNGTSKSKLPVMTTLIFITKANSDQHISRISPHQLYEMSAIYLHLKKNTLVYAV